MSDVAPMRGLRRHAGRLAAIALVAALAVAWVAPGVPGVDLAPARSDDDAAGRFAAALDALPDRPTILVGFDPDLGTYPEVRPTARAVLGDLLRREGRLVLVSLTPEGRALATMERTRLSRLETNPTRMLDLGFLPGAEAALVDIARGPALPASATGALARTVADEGFDAFDGVLVVGGNDLGPRSWIEQVRPRLDDPPPFLAVAPTVLLPELVPYVTTGALEAALATPRDGAAYREGTDLDSLERLAADDTVPATPVLIGLTAAIAILAWAWGSRVMRFGDASAEGRP